MGRRRSTRTRRQRGGFLEGVGNAFSNAFSSVGDAISGKTAPAPVTVGEQAANTATGTPVASAALDGAQGVADKLPPVANSNASAALGLPAPAPGYTSTGGRRRRSRKTRRRRGRKY